MKSQKVPTIKLNNGVEIPQVGFGVYQIEQKETVDAVTKAIETGYPHIDTARAYGNELQVGEAIRNADKYIFVTTKYFNPDYEEHGFEDAKANFEASFKDLGLDQIDLYLIHYPVVKNNLHLESWKALTELLDDGRLRSIGVSNFTAEFIDQIVEASGIIPTINQVEMHPYFQNPKLREFHKKHGIVTEAWSPLARGKVLDDEILNAIGKDHNKSAAQVTLRWHLQLGNVIIPKSVTPKYIEENFDIFDFELSEEEMARIKDLDRGERNGPDPAEYAFPKDYLIERQKSNA
tara:strand:+ start:468 stop:1340 length:873 start_codon:yes stop_codon:yes gene_type:complete